MRRSEALVDLLTETRAIEPAAPDALRERVRAQVAQPPPARRSPLAWLGSPGVRRRLLVAAPVAAGIAVVAIALPLVTSGGGGPSRAGRADGGGGRHGPAGVRSRGRGRPGAGRRPAGARPIRSRRATPRLWGPTRAGRRR